MIDQKPGYHIMTWGCQMNEEDSEQMALFMEGIGYQESPTPECAEVVLLNTCHVRQKPVEKVYSALGRLRELKIANPEMIIGVCGCMAQVESAEIRRRAPYVDIVMGTGNLGALPSLVQQAKERHKNPKLRMKGSIEQDYLALPERKGAIVTDVPLRNIQRRAKLKAHVPIMYGCDKFCTFCIVPSTRGRERSRPTQEILMEINGLARSGTKEITLLGQTVNSYGKNLAEGRVPFARLLQMISDIKGIQRIRFTSPYPKDFNDDLIETMARLPKVCRYVHLPLQVGDNELLERMHRGYTVERYLEIVSGLRESIPGIAISTDIMLGFPGETDEQYWNTMRVVEQIRFDFAYMFIYSPRTGTKAAVMEEQIPQELKVERLTRLIELQNRITLEINEGLVEQTAEVLVEGWSPKDSSKLSGLTDTFKTVNFPALMDETRAPETLIGKTVPVKLVQAHLTGFTGEFVG